MLRELLKAILSLKTTVRTVYDSKELAAAGDYAAEDVLSEATSGGTAFRFQGMARKKGKSGVIEKAQIYCSVTGLTPRVTVYLFNEDPTSNKNDNAGNAAPNDADHIIWEGQLDYNALEDLGGGSSDVLTPNTAGKLPLPYRCSPNHTTIYGIAVLRDAVTGESAGMTLAIKLQVRWE